MTASSHSGDPAWGCIPRSQDSAAGSGNGNSNSHGARPVHQIISMMKWIRTSRLSKTEHSLERQPASTRHARTWGGARVCGGGSSVSRRESSVYWGGRPHFQKELQGEGHRLWQFYGRHIVYGGSGKATYICPSCRNLAPGHLASVARVPRISDSKI